MWRKGSEKEQKEESYSRKEFSRKSFKQSMTLPTLLDLDQDIKAFNMNGILKVKLLKKDEVIEKQTPEKFIEVL